MKRPAHAVGLRAWDVEDPRNHTTQGDTEERVKAWCIFSHDRLGCRRYFQPLGAPGPTDWASRIGYREIGGTEIGTERGTACVLPRVEPKPRSPQPPYIHTYLVLVSISVN